MPQLNNIEQIKLWFRECPLLQRENPFRVDYIADNPTQYSIMATPSTLKYVENVLGEHIPASEQVLNYVFMSRLPYGQDIPNAISNEGLFQDLISWVNEQNMTRNFPKIREGDVKAVSASLTVQILEVDAASAIYQFPIKITYQIK